MIRRKIAPLLLLLLLLAAPTELRAIDEASEGSQEEAAYETAIQDSFQRRTAINRRGMMVLSGWSAAHLLGSSAFLLSGSDNAGFHQMNAAWAGVNLAIAGGALLSLRGTEAPTSLSEEIRAQHRLEKVLLFNAGLDIGYVGTGALLTILGEERGDDWLRGAGNAVMVQGGFLLLFDAVLALLQSRNRRYERAVDR